MDQVTRQKSRDPVFYLQTAAAMNRDEAQK